MSSKFLPDELVLSSPGSAAVGVDEKRIALRAAATTLARYQIRSLRRVFDEFEQDILLPILLGEIAMRNLGELEVNQHGVPDVGEPHNPCTAATPLKPCNAYSIAAATGLPRETVRRKIARLVELDWVCRKDNGHLYLSLRTLQHYGNVLTSRDLNELLETAERVRCLIGKADGDAA